MKSGFVNIVGNPNVGKSTLSNILVGERLSIITSKAQTTRKRIMGIVNGDDYQVVFSDTPGVLKPNYRLQEAMLDYSREALKDADVLIYVTDVVEKPDKYDDFLKSVEGLPSAEIIPVSAKHGFNTKVILDHIVDLLPDAPPYFDRDQLTDKSTRFFVTEIVREKILLYYAKEIPYSTEVEIEEFHEEDDRAEIHATIHVTRESQKGIIIGKGGVAIKKLGMVSRRDIEKFLGKKVDLRLFVKVTKDWRDKDATLKQFGYDVR